MARNSLSQPQMWLCLILSTVLCMIPSIGYNFLRPLLWPINVDKVSGRRAPTQMASPSPLTWPPCLKALCPLCPHALDIGSEQDPFLLETSNATQNQDQNKTLRPSTFCLRILPQAGLWGPHHVRQDTEIQCLPKKQEGLVKHRCPQETLTQSTVALHPFYLCNLVKKG